jgi:multidrug efflux pump subunit AcrA (membrane-fusion protein)
VASLEQQYFDHQRRYLPRKGLLALRRCHLWSRLSIGGGMLLFAVGVQSQPSEFSVVSCVIKPSQIIDLGSPTPGVIQRILVEQSDFVTVGQWVAQIDEGVERASTSSEISADEQIAGQVVRSTLDGFVINRFKSEGEFVDDQPILRVAQLNPLMVEAIVPMNFFGDIQPGMMAEVNPVMAGSDRRKARVTAVDPIGGSVGGSTSDTFAVQLEMSNPGFEIPAGLTCDVTFL